MLNEFLIQILIKKIQNAEINPKTGLLFSTIDILKAEYKAEVESRLAGGVI